jgi:hypothetical protein
MDKNLLGHPVPYIVPAEKVNNMENQLKSLVDVYCEMQKDYLEIKEALGTYIVLIRALLSRKKPTASKKASSKKQCKVGKSRKSNGRRGRGSRVVNEKRRPRKRKLS